jgi:glycosyltransferase involved in cell wall biosynthesis
LQNVWVFTAEYQPLIIGGLGTVATNLTKQLAFLDLNIVVISRHPSQRVSLENIDNIKIIRFPAHYSTHKVISYLTNNREQIPLPSIIHIHSLEYTDLVMYYSKKMGIPYVYTLHSLIAKKPLNKVFTPSRQLSLLKFAKTIVVPSKSEYRGVVIKYPFCTDKLTVIAHGVSVSSTEQSTASPFRLLYVGRLTRSKGIPQLIDAIKLLKKTYPAVKLYFIGKGRPKIEASYKLRVKRQGLNKHIHWLGYYKQDKLHAELKNFGAIIMPSKRESFGLVALESLASGVPLISTQAGGLKEFVNSNVAQIITDVSARSIAKSITSMWKSPELTRKRVITGKKIASSYTWSKAATRYKEIYLN